MQVFSCLLLFALLHAEWDPIEDLKKFTECTEDLGAETIAKYPVGYATYCYLRVGAGDAWDAEFSFATILLAIQLVALVWAILNPFCRSFICFSSKTWFRAFHIASLALSAVFWSIDFTLYEQLHDKYESYVAAAEFQNWALPWYHVFAGTAAIVATVLASLMLFSCFNNNSLFSFLYLLACLTHLVAVWMMVAVNFGGPLREEGNLPKVRWYSFIDYQVSELIMFSVLTFAALYVNYGATSKYSYSSL